MLRNNRRQQITTLSILAVAVVVLSIGFAAFSNTLNIQSQASVSPDASTFSVKFSSDGTNVANTQTVNPSSTTYGGSATINNSLTNPTISGLNAKFTKPGQSVTYSFYARNTGEYSAQLNTILFNNVSGQSLNKICTAGVDTNGVKTTESYVEAACNGISISVKVGSDEAVTGTTPVSNHTLATNTNEQVVVTITYGSTAAVADGPFTVSFGDISLVYNSIGNNTENESGGDTGDTGEEPTTTQNYKPQYYAYTEFSGTVGTTAAPTSPSMTQPEGKTFYLGYDVTDGIVSTAYVCYKRNETEYCLKGYDTEAFATNTYIIKTAYADVVDTNACTFGVDSYCRVDGLGAYSFSNGEVSASDGDFECKVLWDGYFVCDFD